MAADLVAARRWTNDSSMVPKDHAVRPVALTPESAATSAMACASEGRSGSLSDSRSLPRAATEPSSPTTRKVGWRWAGTREKSQASRGTTTPVLERR